MNPLPPNADELVSAYLDGQAAPDEIVVVESSAELLARVEAMRQVTAELGNPIAPDPEQKEAHLAAALGAFDALFANGAANEPVDSPTPQTPAPLRSVAAAGADEPTIAETRPGVASLEAARERRRPRRFNSGVIAAAVAALLLIVAFAALSVGRSSTSQSDVASSMAVEAASDSTDTSDVIEADEEAMDDEEEDSAEFGGLAEADSGSANAAPAATSAPQPTPVAAQAAEPDADAAMAEEEAMGDEEARVDETAGAEELEEQRLADDALDLQITPFFFGRFDDIDGLATALTNLSEPELEQRKGSIGEGIFARCQSLIEELAAVDSPTLLGDASVAGEPREIHAVIGNSGQAVFYIVNPADNCSVVATFP